MEDLTFITGNPSKAEQLSRHLDVPVKHHRLDLPEIQSLDLREVAEEKARAAFQILGTPVLVEDTSLTFTALGRLPGPLIKWFLKELGNEGLTRILDGYEDRSCLAEVIFALYDGSEMRTFSGECAGRIAPRPLGEEGFGWDPVFIPEGHDLTWGLMSAEEQKETSMRRRALKKLERELRSS